MMERVLSSLLLIGVVAAVAGAGTLAYFSDTEISTGNTLTAGKLDLSVNGQNPLTGPVVTLRDLKPSMQQNVTVNLTITDNPGKLWKHIKWVSDNTGVVTEPECTEQGGSWTGTSCNWGGRTDENELFKATYFDLSVNDVVLIPDNKVLLKDAKSCWIPLGTFGAPGQVTTVKVKQSFHVKSDVTNWAQGDVTTFTEEFGVTQVNDPNPPTQLDRVWDEHDKKCVYIDP